MGKSIVYVLNSLSLDIGRMDWWTCDQCVLKNPTSVVECEACGTTRPGYSAVPAQRADGWSCDSCTFINSLQADRCTMCDTSRMLGWDFDLFTPDAQVKSGSTPTKKNDATSAASSLFDHFLVVTLGDDDTPEGVSPRIRISHKYSAPNSPEMSSNVPSFCFSDLHFRPNRSGRSAHARVLPPIFASWWKQEVSHMFVFA
jgi:hypothetical protein